MFGISIYPTLWKSLGYSLTKLSKNRPPRVQCMIREELFHDLFSFENEYSIWTAYFPFQNRTFSVTKHLLVRMSRWRANSFSAAYHQNLQLRRRTESVNKVNNVIVWKKMFWCDVTDWTKTTNLYILLWINKNYTMFSNIFGKEKTVKGTCIFEQHHQNSDRVNCGWLPTQYSYSSNDS